jgi:hypothetical protein
MSQIQTTPKILQKKVIRIGYELGVSFSSGVYAWHVRGPGFNPKTKHKTNRISIILATLPLDFPCESLWCGVCVVLAASRCQAFMETQLEEGPSAGWSIGVSPSYHTTPNGKHQHPLSMKYRLLPGHPAEFWVLSLICILPS